MVWHHPMKTLLRYGAILKDIPKCKALLFSLSLSGTVGVSLVSIQRVLPPDI